MRKDQEDSTGLNVFKCYNGCWAEVGRINFCLLCYNLIVCQEGWVLRSCGGGRGGAGNERPAGNSPSGERICIRPRTHASGRTRREHTRSPICYWIILWRLQVQQRNTNRSAFKGNFKEFLVKQQQYVYFWNIFSLDIIMRTKPVRSLDECCESMTSTALPEA